MSIVLVLILGSALAPPARASKFGVRIGPNALDRLEPIARDQVPASVSLPPLDRMLFDCPFTSSDIVAHARNGSVDLDLHLLDLFIRDGVGVNVVADVNATTLLTIDQGYACLGTAVCDVGVTMNPLDLTVQIQFAPHGGIEVNRAFVDIELSPDDFHLEIDSCPGGDAAEWIVEALDGWILDRVIGKIEEIAEERIPELVREKLASAVPLHIERDNLSIDATLTKLTASPIHGIDIEGEAEVYFNGQIGNEPATQAPIGEALPSGFGPGELAIAASDSLVNKALYRAWDAGLFEVYLGMLAPTIELSQDGIAQKLGLPAGTQVQVEIRLDEAPQVFFGRTPEGEARVALRDLLVDVHISSPGGPSSTVYINADAALAADFEVDAAIGALYLVPRELRVDRLEIAAGSSQLIADPARLAVFLSDVGTPMLAARLRDVPIAPALKPYEGYFLWVRQLQAQDGWLRAGADLYQPDPNDHAPPDTSFVDRPAIVGPGMARIAIAGTDSATPDALLRFAARLDGQPLAEEPSFLHAILVSAADGPHTLEVAAVDLNGNMDLTPAIHSFEVDGVPPRLEIITAPALVIKDGPVTASWVAGDDRGDVTTRWELRKLSGEDAVGTLVDQGEAGTHGELSVDVTGGTALYVLRMVAIDQAGNETSEERGFSFEQGGGCRVAAAPRGRRGGLALVLVVAALLAARRRRAVLLAPLALLALGAPAWAQAVGNGFSGPTDADGAASFWNPAAMLRGRGTRIDVGSGLSLVRVGYQPEAGDSSATFVPKPEPMLGAWTDALGKRWRVGVTFGIPQMDGASWSRDGGAAEVTRYYAVEAKNYTMVLTPSLAFQPHRMIAVGAGLDILRSTLQADLDKDIGKQLNMTLGSTDPDAPFPYADPRLAAPVTIDASGWGVGFVAGLLFTPSDKVTLGTAFHTPAVAHTKGTVDVDYPEAMRRFVADAVPAATLPELAGDVEADVKMPLMVFTALAVEPHPRWELRVDHRFINRAAASSTDLVVVEATSPDVMDTTLVKGYHDRQSFGLRVARSLAEGRGRAALRTRYENDSVPEQTVTPSNMDFQKLEIGLAGSWAVTRRIVLTGQFSHYFLWSRQVDESLHRPLAEPSLDEYNHPSPRGTYSGVADYVSFWMSVLI